MVKKYMSFILAAIMVIFLVPSASANEVMSVANDTKTIYTTKTISHKLTMKSVTPSSSSASNLISTYKKVPIKIKVTAPIRVTRSSGEYVSTSSPSISLTSHYYKDMHLLIDSVKTSYKDYGKYVMYYYTVVINGTLDKGVVFTFTYKTISGSFRYNK